MASRSRSEPVSLSSSSKMRCRQLPAVGPRGKVNASRRSFSSTGDAGSAAGSAASCWSWSGRSTSGGATGEPDDPTVAVRAEKLVNCRVRRRGRSSLRAASTDGGEAASTAGPAGLSRSTTATDTAFGHEPANARTWSFRALPVSPAIRAAVSSIAASTGSNPVPPGSPRLPPGSLRLRPRPTAHRRGRTRRPPSGGEARRGGRARPP